LIHVTALSVTPVKGTRLHRVDEVVLGRSGARNDRRFFVVDARDRMVNSKRLGSLQTIVAELEGGQLRLAFPDGEVVEGQPVGGPAVKARFYSRVLDARLVKGPWADALSSYLGEPVRLVEPAAGGIDRGRAGGASLISRGSLRALADSAGERGVDSRRFRMLVEIDGISSHEEDRWVGRSVRVGGATVRFKGHVGRCLITSRDPDSGKVDLPTLDIIGSYRRDADTTEPLPFGIYGEVSGEGAVRVGDEVAVLE
jgi:uncharacterized protein